MICQSCGKEIPNEANVCPLCGTPTANFQPPVAEQAPQPEQAPAYQPPQPEQAPVYPPYQPMPVYAPPVEEAPETTKNRSAYWAALLHVFLGELGFGYYYRGMKDKAKNCLIMFLVGVLTSFIFGLGGILLLVVEIINIVEAIKLFRGDYPTDAYGRTLYQEF